MRILFFLLLISSLMNGQSDPISQMSWYSDIMVNTQHPVHRMLAKDSLYQIFKRTMDQPGSFEISLDSVQWISVVAPEDKAFRVISWQTEIAPKQYEYKTFIQKNDDSIFELANNADISMDLAYEMLDHEYHIAQLIYEIYSYKDDQGVSQYALFGFKQIDAFTKLKTLDVLSFVDGKPVFNTPAFVQNPDDKRPVKRNRLLLQYSADALVTINYNPGLGMFVFDHLISRQGRLPGQGETNLPDGSYEGYTFKNGSWVYVEKIYNQILDEAPRPKPVRGSGRSITGKRKKNKN